MSMIYVLTLTALLISVLVNLFLIISLKKLFSQNDQLLEWLIDCRKLLKNTYNKLKSVDERGIFEKDDDVGFVFKNILDIIQIINRRIQIDDNDSQKMSEKNENEVG